MESIEREEGWMKGRKEEAKKGDRQRVARESRKEGKGETDRQDRLLITPMHPECETVITHPRDA